ncbi:hypothetical protein OVA07_03830 [Novosphingobium sp. SL115]|uniref:hypothetical protein n=1 Tax=Novosphingobium sp. SL115 TaxID=2995150 RepID=UPI0022744C5B|nr:hypothetical protein [Novosphingobium sp. SL115]MCY1670137.1 hypothetical protein [Novosphingobium sp. SL115]
MIRTSSPRPVSALLIGASCLALASPAFGQEVVFADNPDLAAAALRGERVTQGAGVTQLRLASGAMLSFVEGAEFQLRPDGSVDLFKGNLTVTGASKTDTLVHLGGQGTGKISGAGSSGSFSVDTDAKGRTQATGRVLTGLASIANGREEKRFAAGQAWEVANGHPRLTTKAAVAAAPRMSPAKAAAVAEQRTAATQTPPAVVSVAEGGPAAAAENGVPVVLGEALAAAGASGDIVSAGQRIEAAVTNPTIETFPSDDLARLVAHAAQLERLYGGQPFNQAQADVIRAYLRYLAGSGTQAQFLTVYAGLMVQFLDLVRSGAAPTSFTGATFADINAFITYRGRTNGFTALSGQNRVLVEAYVAFILGGGNADQFVARYTSLTSAYFTFLRGGGDPLAFQGATQATLVAYITFLNDSGLLVRLGAADRSLLQAYLANGGAAFIQQYRVALTAYFSYLSSGQLPSGYATVDPAVLRQYLQTLQATGLFEQVLGAQAQFYASYLTYLRGGGAIDGWQGLPANVFAGYAQALTSYRAYLAAGGVPSAYTALDPVVLRQYLDALAAAGALDRFLGGNATFYAQYLVYLRDGGTLDGWQGLPFNVFTGYAQALSAYYEYLANGGLPSAYTALTQDEIRVYLAALQAVGANEAFLGQLSAFYGAYFTFLANGGNPDLYTGLPTPPDYAALASAVSAYVAYLQAGGMPSAYTGADLALLQQYIKALIDSGKLNTLLAGQAQFLSAYYAFIVGGGSADGYAALPVYANYVTALEAYYAYLAAGGVPSGYTALTQAQILAYLRALTDAGVLAGLFSDATLAFIQSYYVYVAGGGNPDLYSGLPSTGGSGGTITRLTTYTGGFPSNASGSKAIAGHNGNIQPANSTPTLASNGALESAGDIAPLTATATDVAGDASAVVGRFTNGTARFKNTSFGFSADTGLPYVVLAPKLGTLPTSGTVDYEVLAATRPVFTDGRTEPGTFDADLTIGFTGTANLTFRTLGTIVMPETGGNVAYTFQTPNYANSQMQEVIRDTLGNYFFGASLTGTGQGCVSGGTPCQFSMYGDFAGQTPENRLGVMYQTYGGAFNAGRIQGAAVFAKAGTGGGSSTGGSSSGYTGGFSARSGLNVYVSSLETNGFIANQSLSIARDGSFTGYDRYEALTARFSDLAGDSSGVIGRVSDGTFRIGTGTFTYGANNGFAYAIMAPISGVMPTTGTASYDVISATRPFYQGGQTAPGTFAANLTVGFGSTLRFAMDGTLTMPDATYTFSTPGGAGGTLQPAQVANNPAFFVIRPTLSASGRACQTSGCYVNFFGGFGGATPQDRLGFGYLTYGNTDSSNAIAGAVLFGREGTLPASGSSATPAPAASATLTGATTYTMADGGTTGFAAQEVDVSTDGAITRVKFNASSTTIYGSPGVLKEHGRAGDAVAWSRWDGASANANLNPNVHIVTGTPATALPVSGKVDYTLTGSTAPTNYNGTDGASGTVSGSLAVQFGAQPKVGFSLDVNTGPRGWRVATSGGSADPSNGGLNVGSDMRFGSSSVGVTALNANSCLGSCNATVLGSLYGAGASHVGLGYQIGDLSSNSIYTVNGAVVFGKAVP